jgi:hypothetical protein
MITVMVCFAVSVFVVRYDRQITAALSKYFAWIDRLFGSGN